MNADGAVHEKEAEHAAGRVTSGAGGCGCRCAACAARTGAHPSPLEAGVRGPLERTLGANLDAVRVREDAIASRLHASAFAQGDHIVFAPGRYQPDTADGRRLIAHEVTHTLQQRSTPPGGLTPARRGAIQRQPDAGADSHASDAAKIAVAAAVMVGDISGAVVPLRGASLDERKAIREQVVMLTGVKLEHWFVGRINQARRDHKQDTLKTVLLGPLVMLSFQRLDADVGRAADVENGTAEEGLRLIWRAAPLIDRLEVYDEGNREIEQAQLDTIRAASKDERAAARSDATRDRLNRVLGLMNAREEYEARGMLDSSDEARLETAISLLARRDADPLFDAILDLAPGPRQQFVMIDHYEELLNHIGRQDLNVLVEMARGDEVEALIARLRLATEDRKDDQDAVSSVMDRAVTLLRERRDLDAALAAGKLIGRARTDAQARSRQLMVLDQLLQFNRGADGKLERNSFMGLVSSARDNSIAFAADAGRLAEFSPNAADAKRYAFEVAKQRILIAGATFDSIRLAILQLHAPRIVTAPDAPRATASQQQTADEVLRRELLADDAVAAVVRRLVGSEQKRLQNAITGDRFDELLGQLNDANNGGRYGELFHLTFVIARNPGWRFRFQLTKTEYFSAYSWVTGRPREIMEMILADPSHLPLREILAYLDDEAQLKAVLDDIGEEQRTELRLGWYLAEHPKKGSIRLTKEETEALALYQEVRSRLTKSQTSFLGSLDNVALQDTMAAALGSEPTEGELETGEGRYRAALLWFEAQQKRLGLERGLSAEFTETDETMEGAGREFAALWSEVGGQGTLSNVNFYALASLQQRFEKRSGEFVEASHAISELASTIAATVAGLVVVVATGGAATPGIIALAAVAGGGSRVITREMFGGAYYTAMGSAGARDALLGSIDGALAVVSGSLAAKGAGLLGLGGHALTAQAARVAGEVAEEATQTFGKRVAGSAVEAAIDGAFSGAVSEAFGAMTDERNWRHGLMEGLARVGEAALIGGLTGAVGGAVLGAALPVVARGGKAVWSAVKGGRTLESRLGRAGLLSKLEEVRLLARSGKKSAIDDVSRLATLLEAHLEPEEMIALRQELGAEMRSALGHPPGTATASTHQAQLINESSVIPAPSGEHLEAELDVVGRSQPQPSREPGYVDEVELENGHTWRREPEGTWCRFTAKTLCGTKPPRTPPISEASKRKALIIVAERRVTEATTEVERVQALHAEYNAIVDRLGAQAKAGDHIDLTTLSLDEQDVLSSVVGKDVEDMTRRDLQQYRERAKPKHAHELEQPSPLERDLHEALEAQRRAEQKLGDVRQSFYDKLRNASPGSARDPVIRRAQGKDYVSGAPPASGALECDHIVPLREIADMPGFEKLRWPDEVLAVANYGPNLKAVDAEVNNFRQNKSWAENFQNRSKYTEDQLKTIMGYENTMRQELQDEIDKLLTARGIPVGP